MPGDNNLFGRQTLLFTKLTALYTYWYKTPINEFCTSRGSNIHGDNNLLGRQTLLFTKRTVLYTYRYKASIYKFLTSRGSNMPFLVTMICLGCSSTGRDRIKAATSSAVFHLASCNIKEIYNQSKIYQSYTIHKQNMGPMQFE